MKKTAFYAFMMAALVGTSFTACHDDDDDEDGGNSDFTSDFSNPKLDASAIGTLTGKAGVETYVLTSDQYVDLYSYSFLDRQTIIDNYFDDNGHITDEGVAALGKTENYYGGFTPTWFAADDDSDESNPDGWYRIPASKSFHSGNSALICNPGIVCKTIFSRHIAADFDAAAAWLNVGKVKYIWVSPTALFEGLENNNTDGYIEDFVALPAGAQIQVVVYGYVDSFDISNWSKTIKSFENAFNVAKGGGQRCEDIKTLAIADEEGKVTVNKEWQKIDLSSISKNYLFEIDIRVVDKDGKSISNYSLPTDLTYILVDDITFEGKSMLSSILGLF